MLSDLDRIDRAGRRMRQCGKWLGKLHPIMINPRTNSHAAIWFPGAVAVCLFGATLALSADQRAESSRIHLVNSRTTRWQIGVIVRTHGGPVTGIVATLPVPINWPEQTVTVVERDVSPQVRSVRERLLDHTVKQLVVTIPRLAAGQQAKALLTLEITKRDIATLPKMDDMRIPSKLPRSLRKYLKPSPYIESQDRKIEQLAREITARHKLAWKKVEAIYDWVRQRVRYQFDPKIKSAAEALQDGSGDCEELSSLIIAMCRAVNIPARLVWVPGHCYPEFYLEDSAGQGVWFPCQAAGTRSFGAISEARPILQKGDSFRVPGSRTPQRYVHETLRAGNAAVDPEVTFICKRLDTEAK